MQTNFSHKSFNLRLSSDCMLLTLFDTFQRQTLPVINTLRQLTTSFWIIMVHNYQTLLW